MKTILTNFLLLLITLLFYNSKAQNNKSQIDSLKSALTKALNNNRNIGICNPSCHKVEKFEVSDRYILAFITTKQTKTIDTLNITGQLIYQNIKGSSGSANPEEVIRNDNGNYWIIRCIIKKDKLALRPVYENLLQLQKHLGFDPESVKQKQIKEREEALIKFKQDVANTIMKNQITEEQRKYVVQANASYQEKKYWIAIDLYEKAIKTDPFSHPPAYYNLALLYAQTFKFDLAIFNMKKYLILDPNANDARAAQDKIYEWELKLK